MTTSKRKKLDRLDLLRACLDESDGRYAALRGALAVVVGKDSRIDEIERKRRL